MFISFPSIRVTPADLENEKIKLTAENEELKSHVSSLENRVIQLKTDMQRLEEKLSDIEMEGQVLRQHSLPTAPRTTEQDDCDVLILCVKKNVGFSQNKPVAAITIFRCLVQWKSFEEDKTSVFDRLIQMIGSAIENEADDQYMVYWLSNTSTLLFLLQRIFKPKAAGFFERMAQGFKSSSSLEGFQQVEPKYPAILFKQQLTAYVEKIYRIVRDNLKKKLSSSLDSLIKPSSQPRNIITPDGPWQRIVDCLKDSLNTLKNDYVYPILVEKTFNQTFSYINVKIFNSLLLHQELCTLSNGEFLKAGLDELENWCAWAVMYAGSSWDKLNHVTQAVEFLVIKEKSKVTYNDLTNDLCPVLSVQQLHRICTLVNSNSSIATASVSTDVFSRMKEVMTTEDTVDVNSILLDDNSSIPVTVDEINEHIKVDGISNVEPPSELLNLEAFSFLRE